jgi:hypothetical protein
MPTVAQAFGEVRLSYSKVRVVTRVVDVVNKVQPASRASPAI